MKLPKALQPHEVIIKSYLGNSASGPIYADPFTVNGYFQETHKLVENDEGDEVMSNSQFFTSEHLDIEAKSQITYKDKKYDVITTSTKTNALTGLTTHMSIHMR